MFYNRDLVMTLGKAAGWLRGARLPRGKCIVHQWHCDRRRKESSEMINDQTEVRDGDPGSLL